MMNTESDPTQAAPTAADDDAAVHAVLRSGSSGAIALAGVATAVVVALWLAFYFLVFMPRAIAS
jgi:hypothetical protein